MNAIDDTTHYVAADVSPPPALLTIVFDANPYAWHSLNAVLPLQKALADVLVFVNAHLATNDSNRVAVVASHTDRAQWLYPSPTKPASRYGRRKKSSQSNGVHVSKDGDTATTEVEQEESRDQDEDEALPADANKYRPFHVVEDTITKNFLSLLTSTTSLRLSQTYTTLLSGALSKALSYTHKLTQQISSTTAHTGLQTSNITSGNDGIDPSSHTQLHSRILVVSVSGDLAAQYIPVMNSIFSAQRLRIPIDVLKLAGDTVFLQQASDATGGVYLAPSHPAGLLQYLMLAFLPDQRARQHLVMPGADSSSVDFRAACFCHRRIVDIGWVCSVCLSIFCEVPPEQTCLTCGTRLNLSAAARGGGAGAVAAGGDGPQQRRKRKRKKGVDGGTDTPMGDVGTPMGGT